MEEIKGSVSLRAYCEGNLHKHGRKFICPACGSGNGPNHTPAFSIMSNDRKWKCFACGTVGDVFDLAGIVNGTTDKAEQKRIVAEWAGIHDDGPRTSDQPLELDNHVSRFTLSVPQAC